MTSPFRRLRFWLSTWIPFQIFAFRLSTRICLRFEMIKPWITVVKRSRIRCVSVWTKHENETKGFRFDNTLNVDGGVFAYEKILSMLLRKVTIKENDILVSINDNSNKHISFTDLVTRLIQGVIHV